MAAKKKAATVAKTERMHEFCVVAGVEGPSLYLNSYRVAGRKPWGGGEIIHRFNVSPAELKERIKAFEESEDG